ncbi:putative R3H domain containing protein [Lyophyllum shimeji]|uniref:Protein SQS1 n=1 Tax=Lyophyllum shimeji TaxID=47721 RepID=A0A9P3PXR6_LYOSH|nr:putative R3H domain containing protein [Lyophyllum shimeji]
MGEVFLVAENHQHISGPASRGGRGSGAHIPRGRGRGAFGDDSSLRGRGRGVGDQSPRGRGYGRGKSKLRPDAPLSGLLYQERPLLRPVKFVPSVYTRTLFQEEEEIFQAVVEEIGDEEQKHVPTADRVFRVFSGNIPQVIPSSSDEELEEIDFNDMGKLMEMPARPLEQDVQVVEEKFSGIFLGAGSAPASSSLSPGASAPAMAIDDSTPVITDTISSPTPADRTKSITIHDMTNSNSMSIPEQPIETSQEERGGTMDAGCVSAPDPTEELTEDRPTNPEMPADGSTGFYVDTQPSPVRSLHQGTDLPTPEAPAPAEEFNGFYIDTEPSPVHDPHQGAGPEILQDEEDEVIVYVAPHPRARRATPAATNGPPSLPSTSILRGTTTLPFTSTSTTTTTTGADSAGTPSILSAPTFDSVSFAFTPTPKKPRTVPPRSRGKAALRQRRQEAHAARRRAERSALFGSFGAMMSEARAVAEGRSSSDDEEAVEGGEGLAEGMALDPELEGEEEALRRFVRGMGRAGAGGAYVTMDDIADGEMMRMEDEEDEEDEEDVVSSSGEEDEDETSEDEAEVDAILDAEEEAMIAEQGEVELEEEEEEEESDADVSEDEEDSPGRSFQARLERVRSQNRGRDGQRKAPAKQAAFEDSGSEYDDEMLLKRTWADQDEDFIEEIEMMLEENEGLLFGRDRKARNKLFRAVRDGAFEDLQDFKPARKSKDKYKDIPPELREQWQKDREKKAEHKRLRQLARLEAAADPMARHKGGKKGRKAMLRAAKLDATITVLPNRVIDMTTLVQQIRRFLADIGGPQTMSLPPTDKATRKSVHEMAQAFNLKSVSKGKGDARYTTLAKTTRSGLSVDEKKVARIMRRFGAAGGARAEFTGSKPKGGRGAKPVVPRHKEGEEVGKAAPKIGESNIGFRMLALMGWSEGQRIGVTGGLDAPLTAVIKNTKLGLGATR